MRHDLRFDRVTGLAKPILLGCLLLSLASRISAQEEEETFENLFCLDGAKSADSNITDAPVKETPEELEDLTDDESDYEEIDEENDYEEIDEENDYEEINVWKEDEISSNVDEVSELEDEITHFEGIFGKEIGENSGKYAAHDSESSETNGQAPRSSDSVEGYHLTEARLKKIRSKFMYWYFDKSGADPGDQGDYQNEIQSSMSKINKNFNFQLPLFGLKFSSTRVSVNGYLEFSDSPEFYSYLLVFPAITWPETIDPSFMRIVFSKSRIDETRKTDRNQRRPGVYYRLETDLGTRTDQFGVELRERLKWDIREGMVGAETFEPKHAIIVTWKNVSFAGGIAISRFNTFQMVLATDEVATYAIFNYLDVQWATYSEAGCDVFGKGGFPAFVGFNAGNARRYEYRAYSPTLSIDNLTRISQVNGFPGRHMFKIDGQIFSHARKISI